MVQVTSGQESSFEQIRTMMIQESTTYSFSYDYLNMKNMLDKKRRDDTVINEGWRRKVTMWCFEVVDHLYIDRDIVSIAINFIDRFVGVKALASGTLLTKREFQLSSITSLYIALKVHGETDDLSGRQKKFDTNFFVSLCRGSFRMDEIAGMERQILGTLNWRVNPPTAVSLVSHMLDLFPKCQKLNHKQVDVMSLSEMARYVAELSVCVSSFSFRFKPSTIAYASILIALEALHDSIPPNTQTEFLNNLTKVTSISPNMPIVSQARSMLVDICPSMTHQWHPEGQPSYLPGSGKVSPIQVWE